MVILVLVRHLMSIFHRHLVARRFQCQRLKSMQISKPLAILVPRKWEFSWVMQGGIITPMNIYWDDENPGQFNYGDDKDGPTSGISKAFDSNNDGKSDWRFDAGRYVKKWAWK